jgi:tetratricopeptide (TPR) repeat protein
VGAFAPTWVDRRRDRDRQREDRARLPGLAPPESLAGLLRPERKVVEFVGRAGEIGGLLAWCAGKRSSPVRLLVGPGGVGKTRLAAELMERLREQGWACSLVGPGREADAVEVASAAGRRSVLLVVDYAETRAELRSFLESVGRRNREAAGRRGRVGRIRALLIARGAGEWWDRLGAADPAVRDLAGGAGPIELAADVGANLTGSQIAAHAVPFFAGALHVAEPASALAIEVPAERSPAPVLVLHAAALTAVLRSPDSGPGAVPAGMVVAGHGVLGELLGHEQRYWSASLETAGLSDLDMVTCRRAVALMCLVPAVSESDGAELLARVPDLHDADDRLRRRSARWLRQLYAPAGGAWWGSLRPDLLAEYLVLTVIGEEPGLAATYLSGLDQPAARSALTVLARAAADYAEPVTRSAEPVAAAALQAVLRADIAGSGLAAIDVAAHTPGVLGTVLAQVLGEVPAPLETLTRIEAAIPYPSEALADAHLVLARRISQMLPPDAELAEIARWQHRLGQLNGQIGQYAEALRCAEQAAVSYRQLCGDHPDRYASDLADVLTRLGTHLLELGRPDESVPAIGEAVAIRRQLAGADPDHYLGQLAESLNNLSIALSDAGHADEALSATAEAVAIRRQLAQADPEHYLGRLAGSLNNLGVRLYVLGRVHEAALTAREAVSIQRRQAEADPDRHLAVLAQCLTNAGAFMQEDGEPELGLPFLQEAVMIHRQLAAGHPSRYLDRLAASLDNLSNAFEYLHQSQNAIPHSEEGLEIRRRLAATNPDRHQPDVANSLTNLASRLLDLTRPEDALPRINEAVTIRRRLAQINPDRYLVYLAESLTYLSLALIRTHHSQEALAAAEEAMTIYRELTDTGQQSSHPHLTSLTKPIAALASVLTDLGREADATDLTARAQTVRQVSTPQSTEPDTKDR